MDWLENIYFTPRGLPARILVRPGTNDAMMSESSMQQDEYRLADLTHLASGGYAVDAGAHIGQVAIALALDYPQLRVLAVEPIPENVAMIHRNVALNGVQSQVEVIHGAVTSGARGRGGTVDVAYQFGGGDLQDMHRYVGNQPMPPGSDQVVLQVPGVTLADLVARARGSIALLVTDCEGGEYGLLRGSALRSVAEVRGEYHDGYDRLVAQLQDTHRVTLVHGDEGFGGFVARRIA